MKNTSKVSIKEKCNTTLIVDNKEVCPKCMGSKTTFNGSKFKKCYLCKEKGEVDEYTYKHFVRRLGEEFSVS